MESSNPHTGDRARPITPALREIVVVVPAHNERARLPGCLASVAVAARQVLVPVTVIVVLDDCTDHTEDVIDATVHTLEIYERNVGAARAAGFLAAPVSSAEIWFATTDADSVVPTTWLSNQLAHHQANADAVAGTVAVDWHEHSGSTRRRYDRLYLGHGDQSHQHVHGANLGVRADAYWRVGGFRPLAVGEDEDLVTRLVDSGAAIVWDEDNAVLTADRRDCRASGGFGDYLQSLARDGVADTA